MTRHVVGDLVAVGTMVDSCQHCDQCRRDQEQMCREGPTITYDGFDRIDGRLTYGGFSKQRLERGDVHYRFVIDMGSLPLTRATGRTMKAAHGQAADERRAGP